MRALRVFRIVRVVRVLSSLNRGLKALDTAMDRRGFGYVVLLTLIVTVVGPAGRSVFERLPEAGGGMDSYGAASRRGAMIMTTRGSAYWPIGRSQPKAAFCACCWRCMPRGFRLCDGYAGDVFYRS